MRVIALRSIVPSNRSAWASWILGVLSVLGMGCGWYLRAPYLIVGGLIGMGCALGWPARKALGTWRCRRVARHPQPTYRPLPPPAPREPVDPNDMDAVVRQMLAQRRYALLLRAQIARNLDERLFREAVDTLQDAMALVPDGEVVLGELDDVLNDGKLDEEEILANHGRIVQVDRFFLDRYPVTNREFYEFVSAGGYEQVALWDQTIWTAVLDLVDRTGQPGPRYWQHGCYEPDKADHPVVGVSWYEAQAYARWVGKRLPTDAEWVKASSWPVKVSATTRLQRKYPWGETMERARANIWSSGRRGTVPVTEYSEGVSVGGVYQLIGNVWEWTRGNFAPTTANGEELVVDDSMRSIRGGAFDTYFDCQATCQFQSGEYPLTRKPNLGFRCAVGVCDLVLSRPNQPVVPTDVEATPEEVSV